MRWTRGPSPLLRLLLRLAVVALGSAAAISPLAVVPNAAASRADHPSSPSVLPTTGTWFGATTGMNNDGFGVDPATELSAHQALAGRKFAVVRIYHAWDNAFPDDFDYYLKSQGQVPLMSWNAGKADGVTYARWADIAAGVYDSTIDARATDVKAYGAQIYLTFHHEPEPKQGSPNYGTPADFVAAWKHIHDRFASDGVTNVSWVPILLNTSYTSGLADSYYPGDSYVDLLAADGYNWYGCAGHPNAEWQAFSDAFDGFYNYGVAKGKSMFVAEYGTGEDGADPSRKAQWFTDAATTLKTWPSIKAVSYYDHDNNDTCDFWVGSSDAALASFQAMGADPYLNPLPPLAWISSGPAASTNSTSATFVFTSNIPGSTFTCAIDSGAATSCTSPQTYSGFSDGLHTASVTTTDPVSGQSGPATYTWTVDTVAPTVTFTGAPQSYTSLTSATFRFSANEDATFTCQLDSGAASVCIPPVVYSGLSDGLHAFTVIATDLAGNPAAPATYAWTVDTVPPTATVTSGPPSLSNSKTATFTFTSNEQGATFKCSKDGAAYLTCSTPKTYTWLTDGAHTFGVIATDLAGNQSIAASWAWTVDATKPVVTITSGPASYSNSTTATFVFTTSEPATITCKLDSGAAVACSSPWTITGLSQASHLETISATDLAGNVGTATWSWTVDSVPPIVTITASPKNPTNQTSATFKFSSNESGSTFSCKLDSGTASACTSPKIYSGLLDGSHTFTLTATDKAGNVSAPATYMWTIDTVLPVATITSSPPSLTNSKTATFTFISNEQGSTFKCSKDGASYTSCTSPRTYTLLTEGSHTFSVEAIDPAGNTGAPASYAWTIDVTKPVTTITSGPSNPTSSTTATFTFTASEGGVTFTCQLDTGAASACTTPKTYTGLSFAQHIFYVFATDQAGNIGSTAQWKWTIQGFGSPLRSI